MENGLVTGFRRIAVAGLAVAAAVVAWWARPATAASAADRPEAAIVAACTWAVWALALYLCLGALTCAALGARRVTGSRSRWVAVLAPTLIRRLVWLAVGSSLGVAAATGPAAASGQGSPSRPAATSPADPLDWPGLSAPPVAVVASRPPAQPPIAAVTVRPGDTLWAIAARQLGNRASNPAIAARWPRWYAANRALIGPDPDLIRPGERLRSPGSEGARR